MAQQINLFNPILLTPRRYFSAGAMLQALLALVLGLALLCAWSVQATAQLRASLATAVASDEQERRRLTDELARRPAPPRDTQALEQELQQARQALAERQALLAEVSAPAGAASAARSTTLRLVAQTVPASVWLTELRVGEGQLELQGVTLRPEDLRPWLATLAAQPALAGVLLRTVKVERREAADTDSWSFRVLSTRPAGATP